MTLRVVPISLRGRELFQITDGIVEGAVCMTEAEARELIDASILASTTILHSAIGAQ